MATKLPRRFFARPTLTVARELLNQRLVRIYQGERLGGIIVETEAYIGEDDSAAHSFRGRTSRTAIMYGNPGHAYVYFTYGMHWMLNIVTEAEGFPAAVLVRALAPEEGTETMRRLRGREPLADGPAKLCKALAIERSLLGENLTTSDQLFVERRPQIPETKVQRTPRIGIGYADALARERLWRFLVNR